MTIPVTPRPEPRNTVALVVTFHPDAALCGRVAALQSQVARVIVVDNGSGGVLDAALGLLLAAPWVEVIRNTTNLGIATALNQGIVRATAPGIKWILTLDQDTTAMHDLVATAGEVHDGFPDSSHLAVIGAGSPKAHGPAATYRRLWQEVPVAITAGSLISLQAYEKVGPFRDGFFIDYVDIEFCLRARRHGFRIVTRTTSTVHHRIGEPTSRLLLFRHVTPTNHSAARRYYITRNRVRLWLEYGRAETRYVLSDVVSSLKEVIKIVLFEDDRADKLRNVVHGLIDGVRGKSGPLPGALHLRNHQVP